MFAKDEFIGGEEVDSELESAITEDTVKEGHSEGRLAVIQSHPFIDKAARHRIHTSRCDLPTSSQVKDNGVTCTTDQQEGYSQHQDLHCHKEYTIGDLGL